MRSLFRAKIFIPALILLKLAMVLPLPLSALANARYDAYLFVRLTSQIVQGHWLGDYDRLTLAKGAGFPIFLAASYRLGLSMQLSVQVFYCVYCLAALLAVSPIVREPIARIALFAVLLFNPASFPIGTIAHVSRNAIYPAQTGLCLALAAGIWLRRTQSAKKLLPWSIALGLAIGFFWITREEGVWLVPSIGMLLGWPLACDIWRRSAGWIGRACVIVLPAAMAAVIVFTIATINDAYYGRFVTVEFKDPAFLAAYGALTRVKPAVRYTHIPVTAETRQRIYAVSPAFAELRPFLEGDLGRTWVGLTATDYPEFKGEMGGGWFLWAFRDAVAAAGHAQSATAAHDYYAKLADEVNAACDDHRLDALPRRDTMFPRGQRDLAARVSRPAWDAFTRLISNSAIEARINGSSGSADHITEFAKLTRTTMIPVGPPMTTDNSRLLRFISWTTEPYRLLGTIWTWASLAALLFMTITAVRGFAPRLWLLEVVLILAIVTRLILLAIIHVTSFPAMTVAYTTCLYPLVVWFDILVTYDTAVFVGLHFGKMRRVHSENLNGASMQ